MGLYVSTNAFAAHINQWISVLEMSKPDEALSHLINLLSYRAFLFFFCMLTIQFVNRGCCFFHKLWRQHFFPIHWCVGLFAVNYYQKLVAHALRETTMAHRDQLWALEDPEGPLLSIHTLLYSKDLLS